MGIRLGELAISISHESIVPIYRQFNYTTEDANKLILGSFAASFSLVFKQIFNRRHRLTLTKYFRNQFLRVSLTKHGRKSTTN